MDCPVNCSDNLLKAAEAPRGSRDRLLAVTGYAVSLYATIVRTDKPFKDLFGATYEYVDIQRGLRGFAEKVRLLISPACFRFTMAMGGVGALAPSRSLRRWSCPINTRAQTNAPG